MKKVFKYILTGFTCLLIAGSIVMSYIFGAEQRKGIYCEKIEVIIKDSLINNFISVKDVKKLIDKEYGRYKGIHIDSVDLAKIENILNSKSAVENSVVYTTTDGTLNIILYQKKPIIRFDNNGKGFYANEDGEIFPLQGTYTSHVHLVSGPIPVSLKKKSNGDYAIEKGKNWFNKVIDLVKNIEEDDDLRNIIVGIHSDKDGNLTMIPREGREKFVFGQPSEIDEKFNKIKIYYTTILPSKSEKNYKVVDIRYENQIICDKK